MKRPRGIGAFVGDGDEGVFDGVCRGAAAPTRTVGVRDSQQPANQALR